MSGSDRRLQRFQRLPYAAKVAVAGAQGLRLRAWRYGPGSEALVEAVLERDTWTEDHWQAWQGERLATVVAHVANAVPHHRAWFAAHPDHDPTRLADWPITTKADIRADPAGFLADDAPRRRYRDQTSGTSGSPLVIHTSRPDLRAFFALHEARTRRWHGVSRHDRWAILGGQMVAPPERSKPPYWVWNPGLHQLYLSTHNVTPATVRAYAAKLRAFGPTHLVVYPSSAAFLAKLALDQGERAHGPRVVITNAEAVTDEQRTLLEAFFGCPVRETYGMAEMAAAAGECEAGTLHLWPEAGLVEVVDDEGTVVADGEAGRLVLTGLTNDTTAFVRYEIGDRGRAPQWGVACPCGRALPVLPPIEGRNQDLLVTRDGGRQFWINPVFYGLPVVEAQVVQERIDLLRVRVVPADGFGTDAEATIASRLQDRLGDVTVTVEVTDAIERDANGKFRPVVSLVD